MRTTLRVLAFVVLLVPLGQAVALSHRNPPLTIAALAVAAMAAWGRNDLVLPTTILAGGLFVAALLLGHVAYTSGAVIGGAALLLHVDLTAWSAATPRHAAVSRASLVRLAVAEIAVVSLGAGMALLVVAGRTQASRASILPWIAGLVTVGVAMLVPALERGVRGGSGRG
ncbi:MAG: hypothetical protein QOI42_1504 [Frankiaceae bacterium]|nr:hypothetical protein [Frankiaceae bacterium]